MDKIKRAVLRLLGFAIMTAAISGLIYGGAAVVSPGVVVHIAHQLTIMVSCVWLVLLWLVKTEKESH